jgi:amino acid transporter
MWHRLTRKKSITHILKEAELGLGDEAHAGGALRRNLTVRDLTLLGVAAVIGAGIFSTIGQAASNGGPAVSMLFIMIAVACGFAALCYAEFASAIPIAGSAYTYAYASFGELMAWIIGWDLVLEYAIGNIAVAISWSDYFTGFMAGLGLDLPPWITIDYVSAQAAHVAVVGWLTEAGAAAQAAFAAAPTLETLRSLAPDPDLVRPATLEGYLAWQQAPRLAGLALVGDVPALLIVVAITAVVYVGIRESKTASNWLVYIKLGVIGLVVGVGTFYIQPEHWSPFAPNGVSGVLRGVAAVFFAYIGFDALSTTAEEAKNPQRDLPRAMIYTLIICTLLYVIIALTLTGLTSYRNLAVGDPLAEAVKLSAMPTALRNWVSGIVAMGAVVATTSVLLVFQLGQPRILMSMSRDGLLPPIFSRIHPRFRTPSAATIFTGVFVAVPCLFTNLEEMTELTSIGTLFAFVLVSGGLLLLQQDPTFQPRFRVPYLNAQYILPVLTLGGMVLAAAFWPQVTRDFLTFQHPTQTTAEALAHSLPLTVFLLTAVVMSVLAWRHRLSLIPCLGMLTCLYLMAEVPLQSWIRFLGWLALGLALYFAYGVRKSKLG